MSIAIKFNEAIHSVKDSLQSVGESTVKGFKYLSGIADDYDPEERFLIHGLAISIFSGMAATFILSGPSLLIGGLFGAIQYTATTLLTEATYHLPNTKYIKHIAIICTTYLIPLLFIRNVLSIPISHGVAIALTVASMSGTLFRSHLISKYSLD